MSDHAVPLFAMLGSPAQLLVIILILLLLFGASRLGDVGKGLGEGIRNFKKGLAGGGDDAKAKPSTPEIPSDGAPGDPAAPAPEKASASNVDRS